MKIEFGSPKKQPKRVLKPEIEKSNGKDNGKKAVTVSKEQYDIPTFNKQIGKKLRVVFCLPVVDSDRRIHRLKYISEKWIKVGDGIVKHDDKIYDIDDSLLIEAKKNFEYWTDVRYSNGGISWYDASYHIDGLPDGKARADQVESFITKVGGAVFFHDQGRHWRKIALIALIGCIIGIAIAGFLGLALNSANTKYGTEHTKLCQYEPTFASCPKPKEPNGATNK